MPVDAWLPMGYALPSGRRLGRALYGELDWQIYEAHGNARVLISNSKIARRWISSGLLEDGALDQFAFVNETLRALGSEYRHVLTPIFDCPPMYAKSEALSFVDALVATRRIDSETSLHDGLYVEKFSRLLPTYTLSPKVGDDVVLGTWLSGGVPVSVTAYRRLRSLVGSLTDSELREIVERAGFTPETSQTEESAGPLGNGRAKSRQFQLIGRPELETFLNEHVIDIIEHQERYKALGIEFPSAIILHGPPGSGKTFAVNRLIDYLGWPSFPIEAATVASPYIHDTSRKIANVFDEAIKNAPSVVVIDEMEAFLTDRGAFGAGPHRVEEVAEFLRRIPQAIDHKVLIIAMTNRLEMIDPAILRRGRFDHVVKVGMASRQEVLALVEQLVSALPCTDGIRLDGLARELDGRPLSDVAFVVREASRLAAKAGKSKVDQDSFEAAMRGTPPRTSDGERSRRIGFV